MIDKQTGMKIADAYVAKLEVIKARLLTGVVIDHSEFIAAGINKSVINDATMKLRRTFELDILTIKRGRDFVGYILADEVL